MPTLEEVIEVLKTADAGYNNISVQVGKESMELSDYVEQLEKTIKSTPKRKRRRRGSFISY